MNTAQPHNDYIERAPTNYDEGAQRDRDFITLENTIVENALSQFRTILQAIRVEVETMNQIRRAVLQENTIIDAKRGHF